MVSPEGLWSAADNWGVCVAVSCRSLARINQHIALHVHEIPDGLDSKCTYNECFALCYFEIALWPGLFWPSVSLSGH